MGPIWWVRLARWSRKPPSKRYVQIVLVVVAACAFIVLADWIFDFNWTAETINPRRGPRIDIDIVPLN